MRQAFPGKPRGRPCPYCGQEFGTASLPLHMKSCASVRPQAKATVHTVNTVQTSAAAPRTRIRAAMQADIPERAEGPATLRKCRFCRRSFNEDRVRKHESVCLVGKPKKTRVFNSAKQRQVADAPRPQRATYRKSEAPKGKWRREHQEFISSIRYARKITRAQAAGVDIRTLPAPAASSHTADYVQCPFCDRRFAQNVAERHIPKCRDIVNKPKPPPARTPVVPASYGTLPTGKKPPATQMQPQRTAKAMVAPVPAALAAQPRVRSSSLGKAPQPPAKLSTCRGCGKPEARDHSCAYTKGLMRLLGSRS